MENKTMVYDLTEGPIFSRLVRFTLPIMLANALQVAFNLVDMFFIGRYAGTDALSAVSIAGQITMLMFSFFMGVATAGQICAAQAVGAGKRDDLNGIIGNTITLSILIGLVLMLVIPLAKPILRLMNTPEEILTETARYLIILSYINILVALYNGLSGILRGMGDSQHPTLFVAVATVINIVLDYVFICRFRWGVVGAAWATLIGQASACLFALVYLYRNRESFGFDFRLRSLRPERRYMGQLLKMGVPIAAKQFFINGSFLFVNAQINGLGVLAVAVTGISQKIQSIISITSMAMSDGSASMVGQNFAAGKMDRVRRTVWSAALVGLVAFAVLTVLFLAMPRSIFRLFTTDEQVLALAPSFMAVCCLNMLSFALMSPTIGLINGVGDTRLNLIISIADGVVARITLSLLFGYSLGMGALGFFLGNSLAGFVTVIWGGVYFLSRRYEKRTALIGEAASA